MVLIPTSLASFCTSVQLGLPSDLCILELWELSARLSGIQGKRTLKHFSVYSLQGASQVYELLQKTSAISADLTRRRGVRDSRLLHFRMCRTYQLAAQISTFRVSSHFWGFARSNYFDCRHDILDHGSSLRFSSGLRHFRQLRSQFRSEFHNGLQPCRLYLQLDRRDSLSLPRQIQKFRGPPRDER